MISSLLKDYGRVIIRGEQGSAGSSTFEAKTSDIGSIYAEIKKNQDKKLLIEPMLEVIASPNDQWAIDRKGNIHHLGITAQLFEGLKHAGNLKGQYFSDRTYNQMTQNSLKVVEKMTSDGYCGVLGIDYIIAEQGIYPTENNARVNGSTYTHALVNKVEQQIGKVQFWKFFKAKTSPCSFTELVNRMGSLIYNGTSINHVFPYDCDMLSVNGTFATVLIAEDMYHIDFLEQALKYLEKSQKNHTYPELILVDIFMPKMSGWMFLEKYSKMNFEKHRKPSVVVLTHSHDAGNYDQALSIPGVIGFLNKPLTEEDIMEVLNQHCLLYTSPSPRD